MGWCSGTIVFDNVCHGLLDEKADKKQVLTALVETLKEMDWDCEYDSEYIDHPLVREVFIECGIIDPDEEE